ncbi:hypothetical protein J5N97_007123 [Dioscorea zingiberensis]|uniref:BAR domain-containing protein n=1 Tax=Dioscorea zingiberensis TaxID=325984 RepID=A0A9D5DE46_9LILI|nr:hypothetical protein J5N97_007123 [Dioscorea zingiberensis]
MKAAMRIFNGFPHNKSDRKEREGSQIQTKVDEVDMASQDMLEMRSRYDTLLQVAAATTNSAYEFSENLHEIGDFLHKTASENDNEDSGKALLMLGKAQYELQGLFDSYRGHITQTIINPSESLIKELQIVEVMKRQCDDKRVTYKSMLEAQREKGWAKHTKGETFSAQQLQEARERYKEEAALFLVRLKSLKQGQSRSLLTQAARHHAAQLSFFRRGLEFLEAVDAYVKVVAEDQHIDYQFSDLGYTAEQNVNDDDDCVGSNDDELSFDYCQNDYGQEFTSTSRNSLEDKTDRSQTDLLAYSRTSKAGSQSAPISADKVFVSTNKLKEAESLSTGVNSYALPLPTPSDTKISDFMVSKIVYPARAENNNRQSAHLWHSSPLEHKSANEFRADELPSSIRSPKKVSVLKESNINRNIKMPPPSAESSMLQYNAHTPSSSRKTKRQAFSDPIPSAEFSPVISARRNPTHQPSASPSMSPRASPPPLSSGINRSHEAHELPRPPISSARSPSLYSLVGHSAPLVSRVQEHQIATRTSFVAQSTATPLPIPPTVMGRSFSIPSSGQRTHTISATKSPNTPTPSRADGFASPRAMPLPPLSKR